MVVFTAFESGDELRQVRSASKEIARLARKAKLQSVVVVPNVHLTSDPLNGIQAYALYGQLGELLRKRIREAYLSAFGYYGAWEIRAANNARSVLGRAFRGRTRVD